MTITHSKQFRSLQKEGRAQKAFSAARTQAVEFIREFFRANKTICIGVIGALAVMAFVIGIANIGQVAAGKDYLKNMQKEITATTLDEAKDMQALYESGQSEIIQSEIEKQLLTYMTESPEGELTQEELEALKQSIYSSVINNISVSKKTELTEEEKDAVKLMIADSVNRIDYSNINEAIESLSGEMKDVTKKADLENQSKTKSGIFSGIWEALTATNATITNNRTASEEEDEKLWSSINDVNAQLNSVFQSVSDGKTSIGATLTELGIPTLSDASFESIASNIRETAAAHYSNGYNDGYTTGKAEGIAEGQQAEVIYTYHDHTGSAADGSGCFTEPLYHAHTEECYRDTYRQCESTRWNNLYYSWDHDYDYPDMGKWHSDFYGGTCAVCGAQNNYNAASYNTPGGWDYRRCGASIYNGQQLVCTKSTESVEGWTAGCGYTDHQIVKAEILFENQ